MRRLLCALCCLLALSLPAFATEWLDTDALEGALTAEEREQMGNLLPQSGDVKGGFGALLNSAVEMLRTRMKGAVSTGFLSLALCALVSLGESFGKTAGLPIGSRVSELTAICGLLILTLSGSGSLVEECARAMTRIDAFSKMLTTVFAAASAVAGRPISAVSTSAAAMLFSSVLISLSRAVFLPAVQLYILVSAAGAAAQSPLLLRGAQLLKGAATSFYRWFLMLFTGYLSLSGLISGSADAVAVKTAQTAISSAVPVVGGIIAGASEAILAGANALRAGIGLFGCLGAAAICLGPFVQALCHLLVYKLLAAFAASFAPAGAQRLLDGIADAYGIALGLLGTCCAAQFIAIVASLAVAGT